MPVGFRVIRRSSRPDAALLKGFAALHTADLSDAMNRSGTMDRGIQPVFSPIRRVVGPAVTISAPTGAFNMVKIGMEQTQIGDVLVVNARGALNGALVGGNVCRGLVHRGLAGLVADEPGGEPLSRLWRQRAAEHERLQVGQHRRGRGGVARIAR